MTSLLNDVMLLLLSAVFMSACLNNNATDGHGCERFEGQRFFVGVVGSGHCTGESI